MSSNDTVCAINLVVITRSLTTDRSFYSAASPCRHDRLAQRLNSISLTCCFVYVRARAGAKPRRDDIGVVVDALSISFAASYAQRRRVTRRFQPVRRPRDAPRRTSDVFLSSPVSLAVIIGFLAWLFK